MEELQITNTIVTKTAVKKLKRKKSYNNRLIIDLNTIKMIEQLNEQVDRAELEAKRAAMTYIVRK